MTESAAVQRVLRQLRKQSQHDPHDDLVRIVVQVRARDACEYCLLPTEGRFEIDHVVPPAAWDEYLRGDLSVRPWRVLTRGPDHLDNFVWSCPFCNSSKAQQIDAPVGPKRIRLFNPRRDRWPRHFLLVRHYLFIKPLTPIGEATEKALGFNQPRLYGSLSTRHILIATGGHYPPPFARAWADST